MQRNSHPIAWRPRGLSDTLDSSTAFSGAMASLQNLIPDPTTKNLWQCRPAASELVNFSTQGGPFSLGFSSGFQLGFSTGPIGAMSLLKVIGSFAYGMVATARFPGHDEPFVYNLLTNQFVVISGETTANTPTTPAASGAWTPPTAALIGSKLIVTHPGFTGAANAFVGVLDISTPTAPAWSAVQLTGAVTFSVPPSAVAQFNGRAYYIVNAAAQPAVVFSDALNPTNVTNANQVLTFGDAVPLTAFGQLPLNNQLGGIIQALMVFKGVANIFQITGDAATSNLTVNSLNIVTGTLAPNTVVNTPKGLGFISPDGLRLIDFTAHVSDPIGMDGMGISVPFIFSVVPSRMAAACGGNVLRVSVQNGNAAGSPNQEYWYDFARGIWHGPHTLPMSLVQPYNNTFIGQPVALPGTLWQSDPVQSGTSTFVENGAQLAWNYLTPMLPDTDQMTNSAITESTIDIALSPSIPNIVVNALDQKGAVQAAATVTSPAGSSTLWGGFTWGGALWGGLTSAIAPYQLAWPVTIVFTRLQIQISGLSAQSIKIGALHLRYQILRYLSNTLAA